MSESADDMAAERSLIEDIRALVEDGKLLAEAEIDYHKKRAIFASRSAKGIAVMMGAAAVLGFFAIMALIVGLILILGQYITYWGSTGVVAGTLALAALFCAQRGSAKLRRVKAVVSDEGH